MTFGELRLHQTVSLIKKNTVLPKRPSKGYYYKSIGEIIFYWIRKLFHK